MGTRRRVHPGETSATAMTPSSRWSCGDRSRTPATGVRYIANFENVRVQNDGMVFAMAFMPRGDSVPMPPWASELPALGAVDITQFTPQDLIELAPAPRRLRPVDLPRATETDDAETRRSTATRRHRRLATTPATPTTRARTPDHSATDAGRRARRRARHTPAARSPITSPSRCSRSAPADDRPAGRAARRPPGVTDVTLALGFRPEPFVEAFPDGRWARSSCATPSSPSRSTLQGRSGSPPTTPRIDDTFVVANGDIVTDLAVADLVAPHRRFGGRGHHPPHAGRRPVGVRRGRVRQRRAARASSRSPPRRDVVEPHQRRHLRVRAVDARSHPRRAPLSVERETFPAVVADGTLFAHATDDYWIDTGRPEFYLRPTSTCSTAQRPQRCEPVAPGADVDPADTLLDRSLVERGASSARCAARRFGRAHRARVGATRRSRTPS
jgi:hypothetical protein